MDHRGRPLLTSLASATDSYSNDDDVLERFFRWGESALCRRQLLLQQEEDCGVEPDTLDYVFEHVESFTCQDDGYNDDERSGESSSVLRGGGSRIGEGNHDRGGGVDDRDIIKLLSLTREKLVRPPACLVAPGAARCRTYDPPTGDGESSSSSAYPGAIELQRAKSASRKRSWLPRRRRLRIFREGEH